MFGQVWGEFAHPWGLVGLRLGLVGPRWTPLEPGWTLVGAWLDPGNAGFGAAPWAVCPVCNEFGRRLATVCAGLGGVGAR